MGLSIKIATALLATLTIYHQDLIVIGNEAVRSELMSYMIIVPFILGCLIYRKRKMLRAVTLSQMPKSTKTTTILTCETVGVMLCILAFFLYWHGSYTFTPLEYRMASLPLFIAGSILFLFDTKTLRTLAFPIAFLLLLTPPPLESIYVAGITLSTLISETAYTILKAIGFPISLATHYGTPAIILKRSGGTPLTFAIDIACAGTYSLIGFFIFAVFIAYIARGTLRKKVAIFLIGFPLIYALNVIRIITIVLIGNYYGMEVATQIFHLFGGWILIFIGTLILLTLSEKIFKIQLFTTKSKTTSLNYCNHSQKNKHHFCLTCGKFLNTPNIKLSKRDLSKIAILLISAILIINIQVPAFALTQGPEKVSIQTLNSEQAITEILPKIPGYTTKFIYRDKEFEEIAQQDASLTYAYIPTNKSGPTIWATIEIAKARSLLHRWEVCFITWELTQGYQPRVRQLSLRDVQLLQNPPITARFFSFQDIKSNMVQAVLYWYENAVFNIGTNFEQKYVKISLIAFVNFPKYVPSIEDHLLTLGKAIANYWQPIKIWSQIALAISQHGNTLIIVTATLLAMMLMYQIIKKQIEKEYNLKVYNKLALKERIILQAVYQAGKKGKPTSTAIASSYHKLTGKSIGLNVLIKKLEEAHDAGLVKKDITSQEDEPLLIWKSQIYFPKNNEFAKIETA